MRFIFASLFALMLSAAIPVYAGVPPDLRNIPVCETLNMTKDRLAKDKVVLIRTLEGDAAQVFLGKLITKFGPPPAPVPNPFFAFFMQEGNDKLVGVQVYVDGCATYRFTFSPENLKRLEASYNLYEIDI